MLAHVGILTRGECNRLVQGLQRIEKEISSGRFRWKMALEDVHMNIEAALTARVPAGAKLHTGRSRNDQVATDMRLWLKTTVIETQNRIRDLQHALVELAEKTKVTRSSLPETAGEHGLGYLPIPGYTHLQRAQPVLAAHHLLAYVEMLDRDHERFADCARRAAKPLQSANSRHLSITRWNSPLSYS